MADRTGTPSDRNQGLSPSNADLIAIIRAKDDLIFSKTAGLELTAFHRVEQWNSWLGR